MMIAWKLKHVNPDSTSVEHQRPFVNQDLQMMIDMVSHFLTLQKQTRLVHQVPSLQAILQIYQERTERQTEAEVDLSLLQKMAVGRQNQAL